MVYNSVRESLIGIAPIDNNYHWVRWIMKYFSSKSFRSVWYFSFAQENFPCFGYIIFGRNMRFGLFDVRHWQTQLNHRFFYQSCFNLGKGGKDSIVVFKVPFQSKPVLRILTLFPVMFDISHLSERKVDCDGTTEAGAVKAGAFMSVCAYHNPIQIFVGGIISQH